MYTAASGARDSPTHGDIGARAASTRKEYLKPSAVDRDLQTPRRLVAAARRTSSTAGSSYTAGREPVTAPSATTPGQVLPSSSTPGSAPPRAGRRASRPMRSLSALPASAALPGGASAALEEVAGIGLGDWLPRRRAVEELDYRSLTGTGCVRQRRPEKEGKRHQGAAAVAGIESTPGGRAWSPR